MALIVEKITIMPQVSSTTGTCPLDPSKKSSSSLGTFTGLMPLVAESNQVPQPVILFLAHEDGERGIVGCIPFSVVASFPSSSNGFTIIDLTMICWMRKVEGKY